MTSLPARVSKKRGGNTTRESETPGTESPIESATLVIEVSEASELQSPVDLACPMRQESEGFWRPVDLAHQRWDSLEVQLRPGLSSPSD